MLFSYLGPQSGTRRGLTRALRIGPVTSEAAPTRPPQWPEHCIRRRRHPDTGGRHLYLLKWVYCRTGRRNQPGRRTDHRSVDKMLRTGL